MKYKLLGLVTEKKTRKKDGKIKNNIKLLISVNNLKTETLDY